jgi:hypothetical protein
MRRSRARQRWGEVEARDELAKWEKSGLSLHAFAKQRGYVPERLRRWRRRLGSKVEGPAARLVPVEIPETFPRALEQDGRIELVLTGGVRLLLESRTDPQRVAQLVAALEALGC